MFPSLFTHVVHIYQPLQCIGNVQGFASANRFNGRCTATIQNDTPALNINVGHPISVYHCQRRRSQKLMNNETALPEATDRSVLCCFVSEA